MPGRAELDLLERIGQIALMHDVLLATRGQERGLVDEVREVGAGHAGRRRGQPLQIDIRCQRNLPRVDLQDLDAALVVGRVDDDLPVEPSGSQQRRVEDVRPVGGGQHHHALVAGKAVHLGEDLIERLFALVVTSERPRAAARAADRVDFVDEDDRRRDLSRLRKELADATGPDADDHLDELRRARAEERNLRLARRGPCEQGLARPRSPGQQHALRRAGSETAILFRVLQEVDDLVDLRLHLLDAGDIVERDADRLGIDALLLAASQQSTASRPAGA